MSEPSSRAGVPPMGTRVGPYLLQEHVGSGGNARVFKALGPDGGVVALKLLHPGCATAGDLKRFEREFHSLRRLDHPNVIQVYDSGEAEGQAWLAMEYVDGPELGVLIKGWEEENPPDRWIRVERILRGLCAALLAVHESGIVHRDLKPSNVLVGADGKPRLTDFGVVKGDDLFSTNLTVAGQLLGTVAFMSPEQITGEGLDARSDLYALGAILYVLLTGQRPVVADSIASYLARHLASEPIPPREVRPDIPVRLERVCLRLLRKDPAGRYASASEVVAALDGLYDDPGPKLQGRDSALALAKEVLAGVGEEGASSLGLLGPAGSGRTAMIEAVKELAGGMGVSVCRAAGEWPEGSPLVVLVDDLHLREGLHLGELIQRVQARGALLVWSAVADAGARQPASPSLMPQLSQLQGPTVALSPLDRSNTLALLRNRGVVGQLGPVLGRRLHEELGGWPGSIVEQLECLESQGWLKRSGTRLTADVEMEGFRSAALPVPELRRLNLVSRIAEISPTARRMLEVVAVVGGRAHTELLRSIAPVSSAELSELASLRLVRIEEDGLERLVVLQAPGLGRVLCESLEDSHRVALHGQVAEALLARHARRPGAMAAVMADHLVQANQSERAWPLLVQAARRASRRRDPVKVLALTNQALEAGVLAREGLPEAEVARLQGQTLALRGQAMLACQRPLEAKEILTEALALGDPEESMVQAAHSALGAALVALGLPEQAAQLLEPLIGRLETGHPARPSVLRAMAEAQRLLGDLEASEATWREGLALARDLGSQESEGLCLLGLAGTVLQRNQLVEAREELVLARPLLRSARSQNEARCVRYLAELEALDGRYRTALSLADEAADLAQACEDLETWSGALNVTAEILTLAGRERDAARLYSEIRTVRGALELQSQGPCLSLQAKSSLDEARGLEAEGDHFPALGRLEEAWSNLPDRGAGGLAHQVALALCRLDPDTHRHGRASQIARAIAEELPPDLAASFRARPDVQDLLG